MIRQGQGIKVMLVILYGFSQSIFSHLTIIANHHIGGETPIMYMRTITKKKQNTGCADNTCKEVCDTINSAKISTIFPISKIILYQQSNVYEIQHYSILRDTNLFGFIDTHYISILHNTAPPISYLDLYPRIGPIVRII